MTKECPQCNQTKPVTTKFFYKSSQTKSGFRSWCKQCQDCANKRYNKAHPEDAVARVIRSRNKLPSRQRAHCAAARRWYVKNRDRCKDTEVARKFSAPRGWYISTKASQNNCCAICGVDGGSLKRQLAVDHCHTTGKLRGLLCNHCNMGIGLFKDSSTSLLNAITYLTHHENNHSRSAAHPKTEP